MSERDQRAARVAALLDELNDADGVTVWDDVILPQLIEDEHYDVSSGFVVHGTFVHDGTSYARSYYSGQWTTLPVEDDVNVEDRSAFGQAVDAARYCKQSFPTTPATAATRRPGASHPASSPPQTGHQRSDNDLER